MTKLYADRDSAAQGEYYIRHIDAMTREDLHWKSDIAGELAHRDMIIDELRAEIARMREYDLDDGVDACPDCRYSTFPGQIRGVSCSTCNGTGVMTQD